MMDPLGHIFVNNITPVISSEKIQAIANAILYIFRAAKRMHITLTELNVNYPAIKLVARQSKSSTVVFLTPIYMVGREALITEETV